MLLRSHSPRIYVHIGVNLNGSNLQTCHLEQQAGRGGWRGDTIVVEATMTWWRTLHVNRTDYTLPNAADDTSRDKDVLCHDCERWWVERW